MDILSSMFAHIGGEETKITQLQGVRETPESKVKDLNLLIPPVQSDVVLKLITGSSKATIQLNSLIYNKLALNCLIASVRSRQIFVNVLVPSCTVETQSTSSVAKQCFIVSRILKKISTLRRHDCSHLSISSDHQMETVKLEKGSRKQT